MTDTGRKDLTDKVSEGVTPESQKGPLDKTKETASGVGDSVASSVQPEGDKSATQEGVDKATKNDESIVDKAKGAVGLK